MFKRNNLRRQRAWLLLLCSLCVVRAGAQQLPARTTQTDADGYFYMPTVLEDDYFDGKESGEYARASRHMRTARLLGAKYFRCAFSWNAIEPKQRQYQWKFWDHLVGEAQKNGITLLPYAAYTPEWAARSKNEFWRQPPSSPELFAEFMRVMASRYKGKVKSWEIWNEPDLAEYWTGTADDFAELVRHAAAAIRAADPDALLLLGGLSRGPSDFFRVLNDRHNIAQHVDVVAMHAYPESWDEERAESIYYDRVETMSKFVAKHRRELWLNETGYPDYRLSASKASVFGVQTYYDYEHTPEYQAAFLFKTFVMALGSAEVSLIGWYRVDDFPHSDTRLPDDKVHNHLGLYGVTGKPKPAHAAFSFFNQLFNQPTRSVRVQVSSSAGRKSQAMVHAIQKKNGELVIAAWLRSSENHEVEDDRSGMARDRRKENLKIVLPCTEARRLRSYSPTGRRLPASVQMKHRSTLSSVPVTGRHVFVAHLQCITD